MYVFVCMQKKQGGTRESKDRNSEEEKETKEINKHAERDSQLG